jgi:hypothetical protein
MIGKEIFIKKGFEIVDTAEPDFELLVKKLRDDIPNPKFKNNRNNILPQYKNGLTIIRADQCPYKKK